MTITLATLPQATAQEVYSQVRKHLLNQMTRSYLPQEGCKYRGPSGTMCAAGCLISEEEYSEEMERKSWKRLLRSGLVPEQHYILISALQGIHDECSSEQYWKQELDALAREFGLLPE